MRPIYVFTENAYRILGVSAAASQSEILEAAATARASLRRGMPINSEWDWPYLGPVERTEPQIIAAVQRLQNPVVRMRERLVWFNTLQPIEGTNWNDLVDEMDRLRSDADAASLHDAALIDVVTECIHCSRCDGENEWASALESWASISRDEAYWNFVAAVEMRGGFGRRASAKDLELVRSEAVWLGTLPFMGLIGLAFRTHNRAGAERGLAILSTQESLRGLPTNESGTLNAIACAILGRCQIIAERCMEELNKPSMRTVNRARQLTLEFWKETFLADIIPSLAFIQAGPVTSDPVLVQAKDQAAKTFAIIGLGFITAGDTAGASETLDAARCISESAIRTDNVSVDFSGDRMDPSSAARSAASLMAGARWTLPHAPTRRIPLPMPWPVAGGESSGTNAGRDSNRAREGPGVIRPTLWRQIAGAILSLPVAGFLIWLMIGWSTNFGPPPRSDLDEPYIPPGSGVTPSEPSRVFGNPPASSIGGPPAGVEATEPERREDDLGRAIAASPRPENGTVVRRPRGGRGLGSLEVINGTSDDALVKLKEAAGRQRTVRCIYVRGNDEATLSGVAPGNYVFQWASGRGWNPSTGTFLITDACYVADDEFPFEESTDAEGTRHYHQWSVTLNEVVNGNLSRSGINASEFNQDN